VVFFIEEKFVADPEDLKNKKEDVINFIQKALHPPRFGARVVRLKSRLKPVIGGRATKAAGKKKQKEDRGGVERNVDEVEERLRRSGGKKKHRSTERMKKKIRRKGLGSRETFLPNRGIEKLLDWGKKKKGEEQKHRGGEPHRKKGYLFFRRCPITSKEGKCSYDQQGGKRGRNQGRGFFPFGASFSRPARSR